MVPSSHCCHGIAGAELGVARNDPHRNDRRAGADCTAVRDRRTWAGHLQSERQPGVHVRGPTELFANFTQTQANNGFSSNFNTGADNFPVGDTITGNYIGQITYVATNQYGGVPGSPAYPAAFNVSSYSVGYATTGIPGVNYIGVWLSALDQYNDFRILTSDGTAFDFSAATVKTFIDNSPQRNSYYGNPTAGQLGSDGGEPFAYLNFYVSGSYFTQMTFSNLGNTGFESSNHAAGYFSPANITGTLLASISVAVPEPGTLALMLLPAIGLAMGFRRRSVVERSVRGEAVDCAGLTGFAIVNWRTFASRFRQGSVRCVGLPSEGRGAGRGARRPAPAAGRAVSSGGRPAASPAASRRTRSGAGRRTGRPACRSGANGRPCLSQQAIKVGACVALQHGGDARDHACRAPRRVRSASPSPGRPASRAGRTPRRKIFHCVSVTTPTNTWSPSAVSKMS